MGGHDAEVAPELLLNWQLEVAVVEVRKDVKLPPCQEEEDGVGGAGCCVLCSNGVI